MRLPARTALAVLLAALPLAACKKSGTTDSGNASGQILPGSDQKVSRAAFRGSLFVDGDGAPKSRN